MTTPSRTQADVSRGPETAKVPIWDRPRPGPLGLALWGWFIIAGIVLCFVAHGLDAKVDVLAHGKLVGGDIRREWMALQQFGQGSSIVIVVLLILLLDRKRAAILWDYALAMGVLAVVTFGMKMLVGRPRPQFGDVDTFLGPFGQYPIVTESGAKMLVHAWDLSAPSHAQLWSMPSSHTAFAVGMSVFLAVAYPKIKWLVIVLAVIVAGGRLVFDAHWLTDVIAGAAIAGAVCHPIITGKLGQRVFRRGHEVV